MSSGYTSIIVAEEVDEEVDEEVIGCDDPIDVSVDIIGDSAASDGISEVD